MNVDISEVSMDSLHTAEVWWNYLLPLRQESHRRQSVPIDRQPFSI